MLEEDFLKKESDDVYSKEEVSPAVTEAGEVFVL
jgi:hypothetical protein